MLAALASFELHDAVDVEPWRTDELVYQVRDRGSDRTGLWRVRFGE